MGSLVAKSEDGETHNFNLPPPSERHRCPGKASDLLAQRLVLERRGLQEGHSIVVVADIAAPYNLRQEQRGSLIKVDEDGDAFVRFYGDEELWMHKSVLHLLAAELDSLSFASQLLQLLCSLLVALCLGQALVHLPAAVYAASYTDESSWAGNALPLLASLLALPAFDIPQVRSLLYSFPDITAFFGPALFAASQLPLGPSVRLVLLGLSLLAFGLSALEELHFSFAALCRQRDGWAYLAALPALLPLGRLPSYAEAALGVGAALAAVVLSSTPPEAEVLLRQHRAQASVGGGQAPVGAKVWPPPVKVNVFDSFAVGLLGGAVLVIHQLYVATLEAPARACYADPTPWRSRSTWAALWMGIALVLLPESIRSDSAFVGLIAVLPLVFVLLQILATSQAPGVGDVPFVALSLLLFIFPSMLVIVVERLSRLARSSRGGFALLVAFALWTSALAMQMADFSTARGHRFQDWALSLLAAASWLLGAALGSNAEEQQVRSLKRPNAFTSVGSLLLVAAALGFGTGALSLLRADSMLGTSFSDSTLVLAQFRAFEELGDTACLEEALGHADLVSLQGLDGPKSQASRQIAQSLGLQHYSGTPGAVSYREQAVLSSARLSNVTANWWEADSRNVANWVSASLLWRGTRVTYFGVELHERGDPATQIDGLVALLRDHDGPVIVAGHFALSESQPSASDLKHLLTGAGLSDAFGTAEGGDSKQDEFMLDLLQRDYVFYRGLDLVDAHIHPPSTCMEHLPLTVSFQLKSS